ncbi:hypothetical protein PPERSA_05049 [Pseudocohnilembus persalinus]|uniref:Transmembrane protein n=1 Tax=Pseudocohnilembus persalinus TaxID=266149 RepID=A0A0V0QW59_PSEPJ|nr:hypothetical protein PPERSA_05049 [Pseudocohnilembus persalinus]|eukprot:KRX06436.1 hypothetical protein PPERSA_05049 [Pseudocohnilembus persalinus]
MYLDYHYGNRGERHAHSRCKSTSESVSDLCKQYDEKSGYISIHREPSNSKEIKGTGSCFLGSKICRRNQAKLIRFQEVKKSLKLQDDSLIELLQNGNLFSQGYSYIDEEHELWNEIRDWIYLNRTSISYDENTRNEIFNHNIGSRQPMDLYSELGNITWKSDDLLSVQIDQQCEVQIAVDKKVCIEEKVCSSGKARQQSNGKIIEYQSNEPIIAYNYMINEKYTPIDAQNQVRYDSDCNWTILQTPMAWKNYPQNVLPQKLMEKKNQQSTKVKPPTQTSPSVSFKKLVDFLEGLLIYSLLFYALLFLFQFFIGVQTLVPNWQYIEKKKLKTPNQQKERNSNTKKYSKWSLKKNPIALKFNQILLSLRKKQNLD